MDRWHYRIFQRYCPARVMGVHGRSPYSRMYLNMYREMNKTPSLPNTADSLIGSGPGPITDSGRREEPMVVEEDKEKAQEHEKLQQPEEMRESLTAAEKRAIENSVAEAKRKASANPIKVGSFKNSETAERENGGGATKAKRPKLPTLRYLSYDDV